MENVAAKAIRWLTCCLLVWPAIGQSGKADLPPFEVPANLRAALFALPLQKPADAGVRVRIISDKTGKPIAGAHVFLVDQAKMRALRNRLPTARSTDLERDMLAPLLWAGERYVTGADGIALVPKRIEASFGYAVTENGFGMIMPPGMRTASGKEEAKPDSTMEARVMRIDTFRIRAVSGGKPVVGLAIDIGPYGERGMDRFESVVAGATDEHGELLLRVPRLMRNMFTRKGGRMFAQARIISRTPVRVAVAPEAADKPAVLKLPELGSVIVRLYDESEQPYSDIEKVSLLAGGQKRGRGPTYDAQVPNGADQTTSEGARYNFVALGEKLVARIRRAGMTGEVVHKQDGPTRAGELVILAARAKASTPIIGARLVDPNGRPVRNQELAVIFCPQGGYPNPNRARLGRMPAKTGRDGQLRVTVPLLPAGRPFRVLVVRRGHDADGNSRYEGSACHDVAPHARGFVQLGDLHLEEEPIAFTGRLVDANGQPIANQSVQAVSPHATERGTVASLLRSKSHADRSLVHRTITDEQGRFSFRELRPTSARRKLTLGDDWVCDTPIRFEVGGPEQTITASKPASMELSFRDLPPQMMRVILLRNGTEQHNRLHSNLTANRLRLERLLPGQYDLRILVRRREQVRIDGIEVQSGKPCRDPRLQGMDWSKGLKVVRLRVLSEAGHSIRPSLSVITPKQSRGWSTSSIQNLQVVSLLPGEEQLLLSNEHYQTMLLDELQPEMTVTMKARRKIRVQLPKNQKLPTSVALMLNATQFPAKLGKTHRAIWMDGRTELRPDGAGRHRVSIQSAPYPRGVELWTGEVEIGPEQTAIELPITADQMATLRKKLKSQRLQSRK